ncbi:hypothetical protein JCM21900_004070 [Sporobolomyces salmonicolor]
MEPATDSSTLAYLSKLSIVLSAVPSLSSSASQSLATRRPLAANELWTKCSVCRAELVGGLNGSYWLEGGELWARCDGCGWITRRLEDRSAGGDEGKERKGKFERVKKRRRMAARRAKELAHPTALVAATVNESAFTTAGAVRTVSKKVAAPSVPAPPSSLAPSSKPPSRPASSAASPAPSSSAAPLPKSAARSIAVLENISPPLSPPSVSSPRPTTSSQYSNSAKPSASPSATPTTLDAKASSKKRKRPKQPSGLAELLEAKKKREKEMGGAAGAGGGLGLQDFLQGL